MKRWARACLPAGGQTFPQLTCRPLRAPPRRSARPFRRPGQPLGCSGVSDRELRLKSRPGSGTGALGSGTRGSGGGPGADTASSPSTSSCCAPPQPIILVWLPGCKVSGGRGSRDTKSPPPAHLRHPSRTPLPETACPYPMGREDQPPRHPIGATKRHFRCSAPFLPRASARKTSAPPLNQSFGTATGGGPTGPHEGHFAFETWTRRLYPAGCLPEFCLLESRVCLSVPSVEAPNRTALGQGAPRWPSLVSASAASPGLPGLGPKWDQ